MGLRKTKLLGVAAMAVIAMGAGGCSIMPDMPSVPDWVDPTTWFGDDTDTADDAQTPDLAALPDKPAASKPDDQQKVAEQLAADRSHAQYSADALRAGTEAAAPPPPNITPVAPEAVAEASKPASSAADSEPPKVAAVDRSIAQEPAGAAMPGTLPATAPATSSAAKAPQANNANTKPQLQYLSIRVSFGSV